MDSLWIILSLIATLTAAASSLVNQYAKVDAFHLTLSNKVLLTVLTFPLVLYFGIPEEPLFYIFVALTVPVALFSDNKVFTAAAKYGGGAVNRITALQLLIVFIRAIRPPA